MDHFGPLQETKSGHKYILVIVDAFSRFVWLFATRYTTSKEVCTHFTYMINIFGTPSQIITDRGTAFTAREFATFTADHKIVHHQVAVAAPWANGLVERVNRFLKSALKN